MLELYFRGVNYAKDGAFDGNYFNVELLLLAFHFMLEKAIERYLSNTFEKKGSKKEKGRIFSLFSLDRCDVIAVPVYSGFQMTVEYSLPESIFLPIAAGANCAMNQPGFPAITCHLLKARKITRKRCDWIWFSSSLVEKLTRNFLADHSVRNRVLTFDSFENCCI